MEQRRTAPRRRRILAGDSDGIRESSITEPRPTVEESNSKERQDEESKTAEENKDNTA